MTEKYYKDKMISTGTCINVLTAHHHLNHICSHRFNAGENYSLHQFYGPFHWADKIIRRVFSKSSVFQEPQQTHKAKCYSERRADSDVDGSDMVENC